MPVFSKLNAGSFVLATALVALAAASDPSTNGHLAADGGHQQIIGIDHIDSNKFMGNKSASGTPAISKATVNVPLLQEALPEIFVPSSNQDIKGLPKELSSVPTSVLQWMVELGCNCDGPECECPPKLAKLKAFLGFQHALESSAGDKSGEAHLELPIDPEPLAHNGSTLACRPDHWLPWPELYGEVPLNVTRFEVSIAEKVLRYYRANPCDCVGIKESCCPEVFGLCPSLFMIKRPCTDCGGGHDENAKPPCCPVAT